MTGAQTTVMIVDDHPLVRSAIARTLETGGFAVVGEVATAEEALLAAPAAAPDILLVDISLPGLSGVQLVRELSPRLPSTSFVMLTTSTADRDVADAMRNGAMGYLTKDISPDALVRSLRAVSSGELVMPRRLAARLIQRMSWRRGAAGEREPDARDGLVEQLTTRELNVLRLLADGLSDRDIATALTISHRTVETHVGNILRKLGVRNRAEAAAAYHRED